MTIPAPQREVILAALERLLAWPEIARSPQLGRFLDYVVRRTVDGDEQSIKAYSIAVDVFGRTAEFDPQTDPIVRVQARRLRALLDEYYREAGRGDLMQIRLPVGRYVPEFALAHSPDEIEAAPAVAPIRPVRASGFALSWFVLAVIALALAMSAYAVSVWGPVDGRTVIAEGAIQPPSITIVEFQNLAGGAALPLRVSGLAIELVTDLEQFENIDVRYGGGGEANIAVVNLPTSDFVLTGIVRLEGDLVQYSAILTESRSGSVVWNQTLAVSPAEAESAAVLDAVSKSLTLVLGSPRGPLHVAGREFVATGPFSDRQVNPYLCRVLFDLYRESASAANAERASTCFSLLPEADRQKGVALAATAALTAEYQGTGTEAPPADRFRMANDAMQRAISLNPISGFVWEQQARLHELQGALAMARSDFSSAIQLNPANADALAAYARLLAFGGDLRGAEAMSRDAVEGSPNPPPWYQCVPALLALREGRFIDAIQHAELYAQSDRELGPILAILAAQQSGDSAVVNRYLPQVLDVAAFRAQGVLPRLGERISDGQLIDSIRVALEQAGVPSPALTQAF